MKQKCVRCRTVLTLASSAGFALTLLLAGSLAVSKEPSKKAGKSKETVTFAKQVSRIVQNKCETCHHAGTSAPFTLASYDDAVHWGDTIREVITDNRMPPWDADPHYGTSRNDRRLPKEEKEEILAWLDSGMPLGDKEDLPPPRTYAEGWVIGKPDVIFELPEATDRSRHRRRPLRILRDPD